LGVSEGDLLVGGDVISGEEVEEITVACVPDQVDSAGGVDREDLGPNEDERLLLVARGLGFRLWLRFRFRV
jgi:hypothetical protein